MITDENGRREFINEWFEGTWHGWDKDDHGMLGFVETKHGGMMKIRPDNLRFVDTAIVSTSWIRVHHPLQSNDPIPPERKAVLVWLESSALPFCAYIRVHSSGPFWVVYHGSEQRGVDVIGWCDCLPAKAPDWVKPGVYEGGQVQQ